MRAPTDSVSAPVRDVRYELTFMRANAQQRAVDVTMSFATTSAAPVILSLPAWTPGAYEISNLRTLGHRLSVSRRRSRDLVGQVGLRYVAHSPGRSEDGQRDVSTIVADTLDNGIAWTKPDFLLFNGTNVFMYPEGHRSSIPATVVVHTEPEWNIATGMARAPMARANVHRRELSRSRRHAVLRRTVRPRQRARLGEVDSARDVPGRLDRRRSCGRPRGSRSSA